MNPDMCLFFLAEPEVHDAAPSSRASISAAERTGIASVAADSASKSSSKGLLKFA